MRRPVSVKWAAALLAVTAISADAAIVDRLDQTAADVACAKWWNGAAPRMKKLRGRVVVLHFHDPTKLTSRAFESKVADLAKAHSERPYTFIEVLIDCDADQAAAYVSRSEAKWHVGHDAKGDASLAYPGTSVPRTYVVGPGGTVVFNAHVQALKDSVLEPQFTRAGWFDEKALPRKAKTLAKAARELRFGAAVAATEKIEKDQYAGEPDKAVAAAVRAEIARYHAFQTKVIKALAKELDWGIVSRRVERMREIYKGTKFEESVEAEWAKLEANPRVGWVREAEDRLDAILEKTNPRKKKDVEAAIRELCSLIKSRGNTKPAERAQEWITTFEKRLADGLAR